MVSGRNGRTAPGSNPSCGGGDQRVVMLSRRAGSIIGIEWKKGLNAVLKIVVKRKEGTLYSPWI